MIQALHNFRLDAIHTFQIRTLRSLGFRTRVTLHNKSNETAGFASDYRVDLTIYGPDGAIEKELHAVAQIAAGKMSSLNCREWEADDGRDRIMVFHLIPERLLATSIDDKTVSIEPKEMWALIGAQDHHVEYYRDDGFSSGVLYQCGPMNYNKISNDWSTLIQAPKICISDTVNTYLSVIHTTFSSDYTKEAHVNCVLLAPDGRCVSKWTETISPFQSILVDFKKIYRHSTKNSLTQSLQFFTLYAVCSDTTVLPLILNIDENAKTLAIEHSLPPNYYGKKIGGPIRRAILNELSVLPFFEDQQ